MNNDITEIEGSGATQLVQLMKTLGYNKDIDFLIGTVMSPPPNIRSYYSGNRWRTEICNTR